MLGGFAVSAYEFPRLSMDLDIVIPDEELKYFRKLIKDQGFVFKTKNRILMISTAVNMKDI